MQYNIQYNQPIYINQNNINNVQVAPPNANLFLHNYLWRPVQQNQNNLTLVRFQPPNINLQLQQNQYREQHSEPALERTHINENGQLETVVIKNGFVFHICFIDDPVQENDDTSRDWINYDELPPPKELPAPPAIPPASQTTPDLKCKNCRKLMKNELNLYNHERICTNVNQCHICDKSFNRPYRLREHIQKQHLKRDPDLSVSDNLDKDLNSVFLKCTYCNEVAESENCIIDHLRSEHPGQEEKIRYFCEECQMCFRLLQSLHRHNRRRHGKYLRQ